MKKAKIMLFAIGTFAIIAGASAFKAKKFISTTLFYSFATTVTPNQGFVTTVLLPGDVTISTARYYWSTIYGPFSPLPTDFAHYSILFCGPTE